LNKQLNVIQTTDPENTSSA